MCVVRPLVITSRLIPDSFQGESCFGNEDLLIHSQTIQAVLSSHNGAPVIFPSYFGNMDSIPSGGFRGRIHACPSSPLRQ